MGVPKIIQDLVTRFEIHRESYTSPAYNETQLRREFLDPFFEALGWDINNTQGIAEAYKDVIHEDAIKIGGFTKAPDYCFRIGGTRKFFVEAKKPAVNLKSDASPAFQLRRYAWSAKLPISILSDFEEFVIYDTRIKPKKTDNASKGRILYIKYTEYPNRWPEIASIFSRDSILKGNFDKFTEKARLKKGTEEVNDEFLKEIEKWREHLAKDLAQNNSLLTTRELNFSVQRIIDRIIFLRICEDRGIEHYGQLMALQNGSVVYGRLCELFDRADERYNSGLFHFREEKEIAEAPDTLTQQLKVSDEVLKDIFKHMYYPDSPYEFSVLPADILGQVYEQFLGKIIRLTSSHHAVVEEKPEVKKAGGVYYTPTYIVDYIVKQTVGKLLESKNPTHVAKLKILDPACGSGSFLLGAYQCLLDWHRDWYVAQGPEKYVTGKNPILYQARSGEWRLTSIEKKRILLNNIYGVDIDSQAVEVTKLSLSLKVLEGESEEAITKQLQFFRERALPDLGKNIKCGNSLIGPDFYEGQQMSFLDEEEKYRINVFDWNTEFAEIMKNGGFNAVIGNPPWISLSGKFGNEIHSKEEIAYLIANFQGNTYMPNMYEYFIAQGLNLVGPDGLFSFIVPDRLGFNAQFIQLRKRILTEVCIVSLLYKVPFPGITADTLVFIFQKTKPVHDWNMVISEFNRQQISRKQVELLKDQNHTFEYFENEEVMSLVKTISSCQFVKPLGQICESTSGFGGKSRLIHESPTNSQEIPILKGDSIGRYGFRKRYWFDFRRENITGRTTDKTKLGAIPKILIRKTGDTIIATLDDSGIFPEQSLYFLFNNQSNLNFRYLLALLNSRLLTAYYRTKSITNKKSIAQVKKVDLDQLPIRVINFSSAADKSCHEKIVKFVDQMLEFHDRFSTTKTPQEQIGLQRQIATTDIQIDRLVYSLYGLTEKEIEIVEKQIP